jgi:hypothetical protein
MKLFRWVLPALFVVALLLVSPAAASAATTYTDSASGYEYSVTSTEGRFAGQATGALPGAWNATVDHTVLSPDATVTGGDFSLATALNGSPVVVHGTVTGGSVIRQNPGSTGCVNQYYAVTLWLGAVGTGGTGTGSGAFQGTLVHRRTSVFGQCLTYAASIAGSLILSF